MTRRRVWRRLLAAFGLVALGATGASAQQATITGQVTDDAGIPLASVQVIAIHQVTGAERGTYTDQDGQYLIRGLNPRGPYRIEARRIGFGTQFVEVDGLDPTQAPQFDFVLGNEAVSVGAIEVFAARATEQQTPVAFSTVDEIQIERQLASRDLPLVLNTKPSVYATESGGGAGDARINVRGFSQRNVAVMINGVPVNDMENGWVYWSNWDGVGDFAKSIQLQRGLSAVNLATPSIGGSLNLITDPTELDREVMVKQEFGDEGFLKTTGKISTGLIDDRFAVTVGGIRKTGDGIVRGAWTDAWAYYGAASWIVNNSNRLDLYATGAPQRHGQRLYAQNIGAFDADYARELDDYDPAALGDYPQSDLGRLYNQNVSPVSCDYNGQQAVGDDRFDRFDCSFLNERENFYHKPQVNLNWFSQLSDRANLSTVAYYSGGTGGGTGTYGSMVWDYSSQPSRVVDWDATIAANQASATGSQGILRNSRNNQNTIGAISKLNYELTEPLTLEFGLDYRIAQVEHYREVRDLLGGDYYVKTADEFNPDQQVGLGDKIDYFNTNDINWVGGHVQAEYYTGQVSAFGMVGMSGVKYDYVDHFRRDPNNSAEALSLSADWQTGFQTKLGGLYNVNDEFNVFASGGYVEQMPIFDQVINDVNSELVENPEAQKFMSLEIGGRYQSMEAPIEFSANAYWTQWLDRSTTERFFDETGDDVFITLTGLAQRHLGFELEGGWQPMDYLRFDVAGSLNDWTYTDDVQGTYKPESRDTTFNYEIYVDGLKVGNAPQVQAAYSATVFPVDGAYVQMVGKTFAKHYADFNPFDRTDSADDAQPWQVPSYSVFDLHLGYDVPSSMTRSLDVRLFANMFNLFDTTYIMDALDNSRFNDFDGDHDADDAEVFFGLPRRFTLGASIAY